MPEEIVPGTPVVPATPPTPATPPVVPAADAVDYKAEYEKAQELIKGYADKDINFAKYRDSLKGEKQQIDATKATLTEFEKSLQQQMTDFQNSVVNTYKEAAVTVLVGEDADTKAKVMANYDRIVGDAKTQPEVLAKMKEAYLLATGKQTTVNPILNAAAYNQNSGAANSSKQSYADSNDGQALAKALNLPTKQQ